MFARPKMIAPSWPKVVRPVADGKDLATPWHVNWPILGFIVSRLTKRWTSFGS